MKADRSLEIQLWRESTTVFMTSGLGGCGALGLALAALRRGFEIEVSVSNETEIFVNSVRREEKKEVIRLVEKPRSEERRVGQSGVSSGSTGVSRSSKNKNKHHTNKTNKKTD